MLGMSFARFGIARRSENSCKISRSCCARHVPASFATAADPAPSALPQRKRSVRRAARTNRRSRIAILRISIAPSRFTAQSFLALLTQLGRRTLDLLPWFGPAAEMFGKEFLNPTVEIEIVLRPRETVPFVGIDHVGHFALRFAQCRDHRIRIRDRDPRIVLALADEERCADFVDVIKR